MGPEVQFCNFNLIDCTTLMWKILKNKLIMIYTYHKNPVQNVLNGKKNIQESISGQFKELSHVI